MENTLFIVDDHSIVRFGLKDWLEQNSQWKVTHTFTGSEDCLKELRSIGKKSALLPEILIIDVQLINETGFQLCSKVTSEFPSIKCVMYSMYNTSGYVLQATESGAKGYISKVASEEELLHCLEVVKNGDVYLEDKMRDSQAQLVNIVHSFTNQEKIIFEALLQGKSNVQISEELFISLRTVENYTSRIYDKVDVKKRSELMDKFVK